MHILITYDIQSTKNRTKLSTLLEGYGLRVNYSVFELDIDKKHLKVLMSNMKKLAGKDDSVRVYRFSKNTIAESFELMDRCVPFEKVSGYVD